MRVVLTTVGSHGDVLPLVAVACALRARGHEVVACSYDNFGPLFAGRGIDFVAAGPAFDRGPYFQTIFEASLRDPDPRPQIAAALDLFVGHGAAARFDDCRAAAAGADVALCNALDLIGQAAAERAGVPWLAWTSKPTDRRGLSLGDRFFAEFDRRADAMVEAATGVRLGARAFRNLSPHETYFGASPHLVTESDLPPGCFVTGTCFLDDYLPGVPPEIEAFLAAGAPPVVVTFGALGALLGPSAVGSIVEAVSRLGARAIFHLKPPKGGAPAGGDFLFVDALPYAAVFPRAALVVHHGGAGTSAEVCRAGAPSVTVPYFDSDQAFWAQRLCEVGVSPPPLPLRDLDADALAGRLGAAGPGGALSERARALGRLLRGEDGAAVIARRVEAFAAARA